MLLKSSSDRERECVFSCGAFGYINCKIPLSQRQRQNDRHSVASSLKGNLSKMSISNHGTLA